MEKTQLKRHELFLKVIANEKLIFFSSFSSHTSNDQINAFSISDRLLYTRHNHWLWMRQRQQQQNQIKVWKLNVFYEKKFKWSRRWWRRQRWQYKAFFQAENEISKCQAMSSRVGPKLRCNRKSQQLNDKYNAIELKRIICVNTKPRESYAHNTIQ